MRRNLALERELETILTDPRADEVLAQVLAEVLKKAVAMLGTGQTVDALAAEVLGQQQSGLTLTQSEQVRRALAVILRHPFK